MCTHTREVPSSSTRAEIASSKSRALTGSTVNVASGRRSRRAASSNERSTTTWASCSTAPSNVRFRPRSIISPSITSRATSGRPNRRVIVARRELRPLRPVPARTSTRSPTAKRRSRLTTTRGPDPKNGSATRNLPRRSSTATRALGAVGDDAGVTGPRPRRCAQPSGAPRRQSCGDCRRLGCWAGPLLPGERRLRPGCARWA